MPRTSKTIPSLFSQSVPSISSISRDDRTRSSSEGPGSPGVKEGAGCSGVCGAGETEWTEGAGVADFDGTVAGGGVGGRLGSYVVTRAVAETGDGTGSAAGVFVARTSLSVTCADAFAVGVAP